MEEEGLWEKGLNFIFNSNPCLNTVGRRRKMSGRLGFFSDFFSTAYKIYIVTDIDSERCVCVCERERERESGEKK